MTKNNIILYHSSLIGKIFKNCENFGENIMIEDIFGNKISGNAYKENALNYAIKLKKLGFQKGDSAVIFIKDIPKFSYICLAVLLAGGKIILVEKEYSKNILQEKMQFLQPDFLIIEGILYNLLKIPFIKNFSKIDKFSPLLQFSKNIIKNTKKEKIFSEKIIFEEMEKDAESLIVFTGGTTAKPKGVVHTLDSLEVMIERTSQIIGKNTKIFYADLPHFVLIGIICSAKIIVGKNDDSDKNFLKILEKYRIDTTFSPPYRFVNIINSNKKIPENLMHICLGSAPVYASFLQKLYKKISKNAKVTCIYGMTEILPVAFVDGKEKLNFTGKGDFLGKIFEDIKAEFSEDSELILSGKGLFKKYIGAENIFQHKTGDLVDLQDKNLVMKGRKKDMIIRKDFNIYPSLYEPIINTFPGILESALVGIWNEKLQDENIFLFIEGENLDKKEIEKFLKKHIDSFALPDEIIFTKIPRIGRQNKIDKNFLKNNFELGK